MVECIACLPHFTENTSSDSASLRPSKLSRLSLINLYGLINEYFQYFSTTNEDILKDWGEIRNTANEILGDNSGSPVRARVPLAGKSQEDRRQVQTA